MIIELVGGPHCGDVIEAGRVEPVFVEKVHAPREDQVWRAMYDRTGGRTVDGKRVRYVYRDQVRLP